MKMDMCAEELNIPLLKLSGRLINALKLISNAPRSVWEADKMFESLVNKREAGEIISPEEFDDFAVMVTKAEHECRKLLLE